MLGYHLYIQVTAMCSQVWVPSHPEGPCIGPNLTKYLVCAQNCVSYHGHTEGGATLEELRVYLRSKTSKVQDLDGIEVKREVPWGWTNQRRPCGQDEWSGGTDGLLSVMSGRQVSSLLIEVQDAQIETPDIPKGGVLTFRWLDVLRP